MQEILDQQLLTLDGNQFKLLYFIFNKIRMEGKIDSIEGLTYDIIHKEIGMSRPTISKAINGLVTKDIVKYEKRFSRFTVKWGK